MRFKKVVATILIGITIFGFVGCSTKENIKESNKLNVVSDIEVKENNINNSLKTLNNSKEIIISKNVLSVNKSYDILVDNKSFGEVNGEFIKITGDKLHFKDNMGNVIASEKQIKRWGIKINRLAEVYNYKDEVIGYIGEEKINDMFKLGYIFHFYDKDKNEIGSSKQQVFSLLDTFKIYDNNNNLCYEIDAEFSLIDKYIIKVHNNSTISAEQAVFLTIILNSISKSSKR